MKWSSFECEANKLRVQPFVLLCGNFAVSPSEMFLYGPEGSHYKKHRYCAFDFVSAVEVDIEFVFVRFSTRISSNIADTSEFDEPYLGCKVEFYHIGGPYVGCTKHIMPRSRKVIEASLSA